MVDIHAKFDDSKFNNKKIVELINDIRKFGQ